MSNKSRSVRKAARIKSQTQPRPQGFSGQLERAASSVTSSVNAIPSAAIYWGLGALALGAAAVGAYIYRDRLVKMYDEVVESFDIEASGEEEEMTAAVTPNRRTEASANMNQVDPH